MTVDVRAVLVADSPAMGEVADAMESLAGERKPALIEGEAGTGRERIARMLHQMSFGSKAKSAQLAVIEGACPMGTDDVGAAEKASDTLLVKRLCELPLRAQKRIETIIARQTKTARPRVLATASVDAGAAAEAGIVLRALYDRLAERRIVVPPLRARKADIPRLADGFLRAHAEELSRDRLSLQSRAIDRLLAYPWPGNVAELKHICRRLALRVRSSRIRQSDVEAVLPELANQVPAEKMALEDMVRSKLVAFLRQVDGYPVTGLYEDVLARVERPLLEVVMAYSDQNQVKAAEVLGLNRNTLRRKLEARGIRTPMPRAGTKRAPARAKRKRSSSTRRAG